MKKKNKIGILGGTFNPIHNGHIALALAACRQYDLQYVLVMVSKTPPHKRNMNIPDAAIRSEMVKMAVADEKHLIYSDFELKRDGYIYTADTLALLCEKHPENEYYFIIGGDSLHTLDTWYHPEIILQHAVILASGRDNIRQDEVELEILRLKGIYPDADIRKVLLPQIPYSSTMIREYAARHKKISDMVNSKSRYEHTLGVEFTSAALAMCYGADIKKAGLAGLLHDCAKQERLSPDDMISICRKYHIEISEIEEKQPALLHSKLGAYFCNNIYHISDQEIREAIYYHTTGKPNMSMLEKIVYVADYIEPQRDKAPNLPEIRKIAFSDLDEAVYRISGDTLNYLGFSQSQDKVDKMTLQTYEYYKKIHDGKQK